MTAETFTILAGRAHEARQRMAKILIEEKGGMNMVKEVTIRKSDGWCADLHWQDGSVWVAWQSFRTLCVLMESIRCTYDGPVVRT